MVFVSATTLAGYLLDQGFDFAFLGRLNARHGFDVATRECNSLQGGTAAREACGTLTERGRFWPWDEPRTAVQRPRNHQPDVRSRPCQQGKDWQHRGVGMRGSTATKEQTRENAATLHTRPSGIGLILTRLLSGSDRVKRHWE